MRVVRASVLLSLVPSLLLSLSGAWSFGSGCRSNILTNYPSEDGFVNFARLLLGVSLLLTYPLNIFMCRHVLAKLWRARPVGGAAVMSPSSPASASASAGKPLSQGQHVLLTLALFVVSLLLALLLTDLGKVQALVGSLAGSMLAFVLPPAAALRTRRMLEGRPYLHKDNAAALALLGFAVLVMVASIAQQLLFA